MASFYYLCFVLAALSGSTKADFDYKITIRTAGDFLAGTDAPVYIELYGENGKLLMSKYNIDPPGNSFETGKTDVGTFSVTNYLGKITSLRIQRGTSGNFLSDDNWKLDYITIEDPINGFLYYFRCDCWLKKEDEWRTVPGTIGCKSGYTKLNGQCEDVDECKDGSGLCSDPHAVCTNTIGGYHCRQCHIGYQHIGNKCEDVNECKLANTCKQKCVNTIGSYTCACNPGYRMQGGICKDINECVEQRPCRSIATCHNHAGGFTCVCNSGYEKKNGKCENIDECKQSKCDWKTSVNCTDYDGGYRCECRPGYYNTKEHICKDINECNGHNLCNPQSSTCVNMDGTYRCDCFDGYKPLANRQGCIKRTCNALNVPAGAVVIPSRCAQPDGNKYNDVCTFQCQAGYRLSDPSHTQVTCGPQSAWIGVIPKCIAVTCPALSVPTNGRILPTQCSSGGKYKDQCLYNCADGYSINGGNVAICQASGSWSIATPTCKKVHEALWISCPPGISVDLLRGESTASISSRWTLPSSSSYKYISCSHDKNDKFPAGRNPVTWTISNDRVNNKSCTFVVSVYDKEKPVATDCPTETKIIPTDKDRAMVDLPQVHFTDNVRVKSVEYSYKSPVELKIGEYLVKVTAKDTSDNLAYCTYVIDVKKKNVGCTSLGKPAHGTLMCNEFAGTKLCTVTCDANTVLFNFTSPFGLTSWYCIKTSVQQWQWQPLPYVPDCVEYSDYTSGSQCPNGKAPVVSTIGNVCAACPSGTYYESDQCKQCPAGTYLESTGNIGHGSCKSCPSTTLSKPGSRTRGDCIALCPAGYYSQDGFHPCRLCVRGEYQAASGSTSCLKCPVAKPCTRSNGATAVDDCGVCPKIDRLEPSGSIKRLLGHNLQLSCYLSKTTDKITWETPFNKPVSGSRVYTKPLTNPITGVKTGESLSVRNLQSDHSGTYACVVENPFGEDRAQVHVTVVTSQGSSSGAGATLNDN